MTLDEFNFLSVGDIVKICPPECEHIYAIVKNMHTDYFHPTDDVDSMRYMSKNARKKVLTHGVCSRMCVLDATINLSLALDSYTFSNNKCQIRIEQSNSQPGVVHYQVDIGVKYRSFWADFGPNSMFAVKRFLNIRDFKIDYRVIGDKYV